MSIQLTFFKKEIIPIRVQSVLKVTKHKKGCIPMIIEQHTFLVSEVLIVVNPPFGLGLEIVTYGSDTPKKSLSFSPLAPRPMLMVGPLIFLPNILKLFLIIIKITNFDITCDSQQFPPVTEVLLVVVSPTQTIISKLT